MDDSMSSIGSPYVHPHPSTRHEGRSHAASWSTAYVICDAMPPVDEPSRVEGCNLRHVKQTPSISTPSRNETLAARVRRCSVRWCTSARMVLMRCSDGARVLGWCSDGARIFGVHHRARRRLRQLLARLDLRVGLRRATRPAHPLAREGRRADRVDREGHARLLHVSYTSVTPLCDIAGVTCGTGVSSGTDVAGVHPCDKCNTWNARLHHRRGPHVTEWQPLHTLAIHGRAPVELLFLSADSTPRSRQLGAAALGEAQSREAPADLGEPAAVLVTQLRWGRGGEGAGGGSGGSAEWQRGRYYERPPRSAHYALGASPAGQRHSVALRCVRCAARGGCTCTKLRRERSPREMATMDSAAVLISACSPSASRRKRGSGGR